MTLDLSLLSALTERPAWVLECSTGEVTLSEEARGFFGIKLNKLSWEDFLKFFMPSDRNGLNQALQLLKEAQIPLKAQVKDAKRQKNLDLHGEAEWALGQNSCLRVWGTIHSPDSPGPSSAERPRLGAEAFQALMKEHQMLMIHSSRLTSLGQMAAGMAHEINNPLTILTGKVGLLQLQIKKSLTGDGAWDAQKSIGTLDQMNDLIRRISSIIQSLRDYARDSQGEEPQILDAAKSIDAAVALTQGRFQRDQIELKVLKPSESLNYLGRATEVSQVLVNLLSNALDAVKTLPEKWVEISVNDLGSQLEFRVRDSGKGIPEPARSRMMEPFFTTKDPNQGMGLGLSLSLRLAELMGGSLVYDTYDAHTCFALKLPKKKFE